MQGVLPFPGQGIVELQQGVICSGQGANLDDFNQKLARSREEAHALKAKLVVQQKLLAAAHEAMRTNPHAGGHGADAAEPPPKRFAAGPPPTADASEVESVTATVVEI